MPGTKRLLHYLNPGPRLSLAVASILGFLCLFTIASDVVICSGFPSLQTNACLITGRGSLVIWGWRYPRRYYSHWMVDPIPSANGQSYAEQITTHRWWVTAMVPLAGARRGSMTISVPVLLPFLIFAAIAWRQIRGAPTARRRRLISAGLCPNCEYNLRASDGLCPECGTDPAAAIPV